MTILLTRAFRVALFAGLFAPVLRGDTSITFTRAEVTEMSNLWETDSISISPLANSQYPSIAGTWDFIFPHSSISSDGDVHTDMATNSSGAGSTGNNAGESPIISEVINSTQTQLSHLSSLNAQQCYFRGIFRFYTEHASERHFELHPVTELQKWNGSSFVLDTDFRANVVADPNGTTHSSSTLTSVLDGSSTVTATIASDNTNVNFTFPSPSVNYTQYDGVATSPIQSDALSSYFYFKPNLVPSANVRCRLVANTAAANAAAGLITNQSITVNALTRTDMSAVATQISTMGAGASKTFGRPIELIVLGLPGLSGSPTPTPSPTPTATPTPTVTPTPTPTATPTATPGPNSFANTAKVTITGASTGKGSPYPDAITVSGVAGKISKVTAQLVGVVQNSTSDFGTDIDIQMVGPQGQNVMLMSDAGGSTRISPAVTLTFDDAAAAMLSATTKIASGTFKPTDYSGDADAFPSPAPSVHPGTSLAIYNGQSPNGIWNLFVLDEWSGGRGSINTGWVLNIFTQLSAPFVTTNAAGNLTSYSATLNGTIDPTGQVSTYQFELGTDATYGFTQPVQSAGGAIGSVAVSLNVNGLQPGTTYHYRLFGTNDTDTTFGLDRTFVTAAFVDSDGDGIPDDYEIAHGLNPNDAADGSADSDGDGMTNYQEYLAGTDPNSASSVLRIQSIQVIDGDVVVSFPSVFGKKYRIDQRGDLSSSWMPLSDNIPGTGDLVSVTDVEAGDNNAQRFYRVVLMQ